MRVLSRVRVCFTVKMLAAFVVGIAVESVRRVESEAIGTGTDRRRRRRHQEDQVRLYTPVCVNSNFAVVATDDSIVNLQKRLEVYENMLNVREHRERTRAS